MRPLIVALALMLGGCRGGGVVGVEEGRCAGIIGDPSIATSCVIVEGRVLNSGNVGVGSVNLSVDCFGPETLGCYATPGETGPDGTYRLVVHNLRREGGPGSVMVQAHDRLSDGRAVSDTLDVAFAAMGAVAPVYVVHLHLADATTD